MPPPAAPPPDNEAPLPRAQVRTACAVVGCLSLVVIAALAALIYIVLTVLSELAPPASTSGDKGKKASALRPDPIVPTKLAGDRATLALEARFDAVGRAANGRFLVFRMPSGPPSLAVFDPVEAKVVKTLPIGEPNAPFAGSAGKLYVYRPKAKQLDRYDLTTWEKEESIEKPDTISRFDQLLVGVGTDGPVLAVLTGEEASTVAVVSPPAAEWGLQHVPSWSLAARQLHLRASADGRTFGGVSRLGDSTDGKILRFTPPGAFDATALKKTTLPTGHLTPSPNGESVYSSRGVFTRNGTLKIKPDDYLYSFPTAHGNELYLSVDAVAKSGVLQGPLRLHQTAASGVLATLDQIELPRGLTAADENLVSMDQRIHLWPAAGLLAVLPNSNTKIELYKVDVPGLLRASGQQYTIFGSEPPTVAIRGTTWSYQPVVWSSREGTTLTQSGPKGMAFKDKVLEWTVPSGESLGEVEVRITATAPGAPAVMQTFRINVIDPPANP